MSEIEIPEIPAAAIREAEGLRARAAARGSDLTSHLEGRPLYYDRTGRPIDLWLFGALHERMDYKRVREDTIGPFWVSTVWVGHDMNYTMQGPPIIFETMVFGADDPEWAGHEFEMQRYSTEEEAHQGHEEICAAVRSTLARLHREAGTE